MTILTGKILGAVMKSAMKKAGVKKPTFPGPRSIKLLNKKLKEKQKYRHGKFSGSDIVESSPRMLEKSKKPGKSFIEIDARINKSKE
jgi:hypothetical protein